MAHGKNSRKKNRDKRAVSKKARRESNQLKYQSLAADGKNKKSKRFVLSSRKRSSNTKHTHPNGYCGNIGCVYCFPRDAFGKLVVKGPSHELSKDRKELLVKGTITHIKPRRPNRGRSWLREAVKPC